MNPKRPLKDKLYPNYGDDDEYYYEEESKIGTVAKILLYTLLFGICAVCVWFFAIYLPDYFIPEGRDLEGIIKVSNLDVALRPISQDRVKQLGLDDVGEKYVVDDENSDTHDNDDGGMKYADEEYASVLRLGHTKTVERLIVIGDIHGHYTKLRKLLRKLKFNHKTDHVLMLGDFIAKGPDSIKVLDFAISNNLDCILGNHEFYVLQNYAQFHRLDAPRFIDQVSPSDFEVKEKFNTDPEYLLAKKLQPHHVDYINSCLVIKKLGKVPLEDSSVTNGLGYTNGVAVHGGLRWDLPLEEQDSLKCLEMRSYIGPHFNESTDDPSENHAVSWSKIWNQKQKKKPIKETISIYYGHDARRGLKIKPFSKGLDTGCFKGGRLTAMVIWEQEAKKGKKIDILHKEKLVSISC